MTESPKPPKQEDGAGFASSQQTATETPTTPKRENAANVAPAQRTAAGTPQTSRSSDAASAARAALRMRSTQPTRSSSDSQNSARKTRTGNPSSSWGKNRECRPLPSNPLAGIPRPVHGQVLPVAQQRVVDERQRTRDEALSLLESSGMREGTSHEDASNYGKQVLAQPLPRRGRTSGSEGEAATSQNIAEQPQRGLASETQPESQRKKVLGGAESGATSSVTELPEQNLAAQPQVCSESQAKEGRLPSTGSLNDQYHQALDEPTESLHEPRSGPAVPHKDVAGSEEDPHLMGLVEAAEQAADKEQQLTRQAEEELYAREAATEEAKAREDELQRNGLKELEALEEESREAARREAQTRQEVRRVADGLRAEAEQAARRVEEYEEQAAAIIERYAIAAQEAYTNAMIAREELEGRIQGKENITRVAFQEEKEVRDTYRHSRELFDAAASNEQIARTNLENRPESTDATQPFNPTGGDANVTTDRDNRTAPHVIKNETSPRNFRSTQPAELMTETGGPTRSQGGTSEFEQDDLETQDGLPRTMQSSRIPSLGESMRGTRNRKDTKKKRNRLSSFFHRDKKNKDTTASAASSRHSTGDWSSNADPTDQTLQRAAREAAARDMANLGSRWGKLDNENR